MVPLLPGHLSECRFRTYEDENPWDEIPEKQRPAVSREFWREAGFMRCAPGCPRRKALTDRGRELAKRYGWL